MNQLHPSVKTVWSITIFFRMLMLSLVIIISGYFIISSDIVKSLIPIGYTIIALIIIILIGSIIYPILKYYYWKFEIRQAELYIERGVLTRIKTIAPFSRIQHLDVQQSILERMLGLAKLVIYTAGTRGADIIIPGLPLQYAEALRDQLKNYSPDDAV